MKVRAHVFVSGRVQGVFFRYETKRQAEKLDVTGWVRNLSDGRVEAILEGEKESIDKLIEFCEKGPKGARVTSAAVTLETYRNEFRDFKITW